MAEETKKVDAETTVENATQEVNEEVDYDKELEIAAEKQRNAEFAQRRIAKKAEVEGNEGEDDIADRVAAKILPKLQATAEHNALEINLDKKAQGNESLKKLIKFHYDNSVNPNMDMNERMEAAYAIAQKKTIDKTVKEINVARQNRSQISNVGQGSNQEVYKKPGQNVFSDAQVEALRAQHKAQRLPSKFEDYLANMIRRMTS